MALVTETKCPYILFIPTCFVTKAKRSVPFVSPRQKEEQKKTGQCSALPCFYDITYYSRAVIAPALAPEARFSHVEVAVTLR